MIIKRLVKKNSATTAAYSPTNNIEMMVKVMKPSAESVVQK